MISSLSELYRLNIFNVPNIISFIFSLAMMGILLFALGLSFYAFYSTKKFYDSDKYYKLGEFYAGIKEDKYARIYAFMALIRRTLMVVWLLSMDAYQPFVLSSGLLVLQVLYFIYI